MENAAAMVNNFSVQPKHIANTLVELQWSDLVIEGSDHHA